MPEEAPCKLLNAGKAVCARTKRSFLLTNGDFYDNLRLRAYDNSSPAE